MSDEGPWKDPKWAKPAKWEKKVAEKQTIDTGAVNPGTIPDAGTTPAPAQAPAPVEVDEIKAAPAAP